MSAADAEALKLSDGAHLITGRRSAKVLIEISPMMRPGHVALPKRLGLTSTPNGEPVGVAPNELTSSDHRDPIAHAVPQARPRPTRADRVVTIDHTHIDAALTTTPLRRRRPNSDWPDDNDVLLE